MTSLCGRWRAERRFTYKVFLAKITGVGYFDFIHGQSGASRNGLELHPVLRIDVLEEGREESRVPERAEPAPRTELSAETVTAKVWVNVSSGV